MVLSVFHYAALLEVRPECFVCPAVACWCLGTTRWATSFGNFTRKCRVQHYTRRITRMLIHRSSASIRAKLMQLKCREATITLQSLLQVPKYLPRY